MLSATRRVEETGFVDRLSGTYTTKEWWTADQPVFAASEVWTILALLGEHGHDPLKLLAAAEIDLSALLDPAVRLSLRQHVRLYELMAEVGAGSLSILLGKQLHLSTFAAPGFAVLSSPFLGKALNTLLRFAPLLNLKFPMKIQFGEAIRISIDKNIEIESANFRNLFACELLKIITFLKDILGTSFSVLRLTVGGLDSMTERMIAQFAGVASTEPAIGLRALIEMDAGSLSRPLSQSHSPAHRRAVDECDRVINDLRAKADPKVLILKRLRRLDVRIPTFAEIAAELHMSERTLRRRLEKSQTSYSRILDELREELAAGYVLESGRTTENIAERLGYSDAANFRHAFKRWTGQPPTAFRVGRTKAAPAC